MDAPKTDPLASISNQATKTDMILLNLFIISSSRYLELSYYRQQGHADSGNLWQGGSIKQRYILRRIIVPPDIRACSAARIRANRQPSRAQQVGCPVDNEVRHHTAVRRAVPRDAVRGAQEVRIKDAEHG